MSAPHSPLPDLDECQEREPAQRDLDFIVIGVQKGGTTSLWQYLRRHPKIAMPEFKEAPIFLARPERLAGWIAWLGETSFRGLGADVRLGKVAPQYMMGVHPMSIERIAARVARTLPDVRLIALLRDPIDRAISHYRMSVRRGLERRPLDAAVEQLLAPEQQRAARTRPSETNSYFAQGEYGRVLSIYRASFPAERIHVAQTSDLAADPGAVLDRVLAFLGLETGYRPERLAERHHRGGMKPRVDAEGEEQLRAFMEENVWPRLVGDAEHMRRVFEFFLETWNVVPDEHRPPLSRSCRARLEDHYRADAEQLGALGIDAPWLAAWGTGG